VTPIIRPAILHPELTGSRFAGDSVRDNLAVKLYRAFWIGPPESVAN
jgi:hypothetical protein